MGFLCFFDVFVGFLWVFLVDFLKFFGGFCGFFEVLWVF